MIQINIRLTVIMICAILQLFAKAPQYYNPEHIELETRFTNEFIKEIEKEFGFHCYGVGSSVSRDIQMISVCFAVNKPADVQSARALLVTLVEKFREKMNNCEYIRPYLREYPFPAHRIEIMLAFPNGNQTNSYQLTRVAQLINNIIYWQDNVKDPQKPSIKLGFETYPEALEKVRNPTGLSLNTLRTGEHLRPRDFTAGYGKEFDEIESKRPPPATHKELKKLTENEILGIKDIDPSNLSAVIEELIDGFYTPGFDKAFFEHVAQMQKEHPNEHYVEYWDNGKKKWEATFAEGMPDGHFHGWYYHGQEAFKGFHRKGVRVGSHMGFYWQHSWMFGGDDSAAISREFYYDMTGARDGEHAIYHEKTGTLLCCVRYKHGLRHGEVVGYEVPWERETLYREYKEGKLIRDKRKKR